MTSRVKRRPDARPSRSSSAGEPTPSVKKAAVFVQANDPGVAVYVQRRCSCGAGSFRRECTQMKNSVSHKQGRGPRPEGKGHFVEENYSKITPGAFALDSRGPTDTLSSPKTPLNSNGCRSSGSCVPSSLEASPRVSESPQEPSARDQKRRPMQGSGETRDVLGRKPTESAGPPIRLDSPRCSSRVASRPHADPAAGVPIHPGTQLAEPLYRRASPIPAGTGEEMA